MKFPFFVPAMSIAIAAFAGPPLTTIQDTLYKADGNRFNGTLTISWSSFQSMDQSAVVTQSTTVKIVNGNLWVQLVPTTTATPTSYYQVTYNSDGRIQFTETWAVPSSSTPIRVRDVRTSSSLGQQQTSGNATAPIQESDVIGLVADLSARPIMGPGYAPGRVAVVSASGALESVSGNLSDCVRVDGTAGPCGAQPPSFVDNDTLSGIVDGANASFSLTAMPEPLSSLAVYRNGLLQKAGLDYSVSGREVVFIPEAIPQPGDTLLASYRLAGSESGPPVAFPAAQVLCSGTGLSTSSTAMGSIGACFIPAATLIPGDRVEIRFDLEHQGTAGGFTFEVKWGGTTVLHRDGSAADVLATGRADASILTSVAHISSQSWGTALPMDTTIGTASDAYGPGLKIDIQGRVLQAGDTLSLRNYTVVRVP